MVHFKLNVWEGEEEYSAKYWGRSGAQIPGHNCHHFKSLQGTLSLLNREIESYRPTATAGFGVHWETVALYIVAFYKQEIIEQHNIPVSRKLLLSLSIWYNIA